ncbi:LacI family DNA-binding transcriptional regulator [Tranquillimonas rosea]|uniref:LacI family DNA-binding transcriptional regulator n=1 Tax=Tranquillimonas rosea TaxID=641238 RepID=UPI003BAB0727
MLIASLCQDVQPDGGAMAGRTGAPVNKPKINTMEELSTAIGVSRPTLSRYFQDPDSVRSSTSEKIRRGLERVEYIPNFFATRMNRKTTGLIGVIFPHLKDLFFTSLLEAIETAAMEADLTIITQSSHGDPAIETRAVEQLLSMNADGVIVAPLGENSDVDALSRVAGRLPFVFIDSRLRDALPDVDFVGTDNRQSVSLITDYLCRTGSPPVFLGMPRLNSNSFEREAAYIAEMKHLGHDPVIVSTNIKGDGWAFEAYAHEVMDDLFSRGHLTESTILCANDRLAIGAIRAASRHGLFSRGREGRRILRIAGHDDHPLSRFMTPALTTAAQDTEAIGRGAVRILTERLRKSGGASDKPVFQLHEAVLRVRESA